MDEIEHALAFRGGNPSLIGKKEIIRQLADTFATILLNENNLRNTTISSKS